MEKTIYVLRCVAKYGDNVQSMIVSVGNSLEKIQYEMRESFQIDQDELMSQDAYCYEHDVKVTTTESTCDMEWKNNWISYTITNHLINI